MCLSHNEAKFCQILYQMFPNFPKHYDLKLNIFDYIENEKRKHLQNSLIRSFRLVWKIVLLDLPILCNLLHNRIQNWKRIQKFPLNFSFNELRQIVRGHPYLISRLGKRDNDFVTTSHPVIFLT